MLLRAILATLALLLLGLAQPPRAEARDSVRVGIYLLSLYDLDFPNNSFTADFWMWFLYRNKEREPLKNVEIANAKSFSFVLPDVEEKNGVHWATQKCKATIRKDWDVSNFPFDRQTLEVMIEEGDADTSDVFYIADTANSKRDPSVEVDGWQIETFSVRPTVRHYPTTYGDPELAGGGGSAYPGVIASATLRRDGVGLFFKLFTGVYVAFLIALLVFFIHSERLDIRTGLSVGALFATVGNKYIVDSILPDSTSFTLVDALHTVTFAAILLTVVISVISMWLASINRVRTAHLLDHISAAVLGTTYATFNLLMIVRATTS